MTELEVYMQPFRITQWRDGCVFRTDPQPCGWFPEPLVRANKPAETGIIYAPASDEFSRNNMTIRTVKRNTQP